MQAWYADDATASGSIPCDWWSKLSSIGPAFGFAAITWLITKDQHLSKAKILFQDTKVPHWVPKNLWANLSLIKSINGMRNYSCSQTLPEHNPMLPLFMALCISSPFSAEQTHIDLSLIKSINGMRNYSCSQTLPEHNPMLPLFMALCISSPFSAEQTQILTRFYNFEKTTSASTTLRRQHPLLQP